MSVVFTNDNAIYLTRTTGLPDYSNTYTVAGWYNVTAQKPVADSCLRLIRADANHFDAVELGHATGPGPMQVFVYRGDSSPLISITGGPALPLSTWFHLAVVFYPTSVSIYYNGYPLHSESHRSLTARNTPVLDNIGYYDATYNDTWAGSACCIKTWSRGLSDSEILCEAYSVNPNLTDPSLNSFVPLLDGSIIDASGRGSNWKAAVSPLAASSNPPGLMLDNDPAFLSWHPGKVVVPDIYLRPVTAASKDIWLYDPSIPTSSGLRALVLINGNLYQVPLGQEGTLTPLTMLNGDIAQRTSGAQLPLVLDNGVIRQASSGETVIT